MLVPQGQTARMTRDASWDLPLPTRLLALALRHSRASVTQMSVDELPAVRARVIPARWPVSLITGPAFADVAISMTSFRARDGHEVPVRVYRPRPSAGGEAPPVLVWCHGGGWVLGNVRNYDPICSWLSHRAGVVVVSVDYRLAPEHRAPTAAYDCVDATRWVTSTADENRWHAKGLGVAGDSAGGNLAAVVAQVVRDEGGADIRHQSLIYPGVDATRSSASMAEHARAPILTRDDIDVFLGHYRGEGPDALGLKDPLLSPLYAADLAGLPPALVQTADLDPLRDEGMAYAAALRKAGVDVRLTNYRRAPHGFISFPGLTRVGEQARWELADWVAHHAATDVVH